MVLRYNRIIVNLQHLKADPDERLCYANAKLQECNAPLRNVRLG